MPLSSLEEYLNREFGELPASGLEGRARRRGESLVENAPSSGSGLGGAPSGIPVPEFGGMSEAAKSDEGSMDRTRLLGAGVADLAEMVVGVPEYIARQNKFLRPSVAPALESVRGGINEIREGILSGVSPEYLDHVGRELLTLDPDKTIWKGGPIEVADAVYGKFVRSLPSTLAVMLPAARMMKAASTGGALTYLGASEGSLSLGGIQNNIADEIAGMTHEELLKESQRYAQIYDGDETTARQQFTAETQGLAPVLGGVGVAAISMVTGRLLRPVFEPMKDAAGVQVGMGLGKRIGTGFAAEAPQEGSQGSIERLAENAAAQAYDQNRNLSEGVGEAFAQEGLIGGLTGGAVTGAVGQRPGKPLPPPAEGPGGQFNLPGMTPAQRDVPDQMPNMGIPETDIDENGRPFSVDPAEVGQRNEQLPLQGGMDFDARSGRDLSTETEGVMLDPAGGVGPQQVLPLQDTRPLRERGPGARVMSEENAPTIPDALDQPTAEPVEDLQAQVEDMMRPNGRSAVYVSPEQGPIEGLKLPKGAVIIPNFDGKGGRLIAKNKQAAQYARERRAEGGSMQAIIGELTLAGAGKPNVRAGYAVQLLGEDGAVARESLVRTKGEANALEKEWSTPEPAEAPLITVSLFNAKGRLQSSIQTTDEAEAKAKEAEFRKAAGNAPDGMLQAGEVTVSVAEAAAPVTPEVRVLTGPEALARRGDVLEKEQIDISTQDPTEVDRRTGDLVTGEPSPSSIQKPETRSFPEDTSIRPSEVDTFDETQTVEQIEALPDFEVEYSEITEATNKDKTLSYTETRQRKAFKSRGQAKSYGTRMTNKAKAVGGPEIAVKEPKVSAVESERLETTFQAAVQSRADTEQGVEVPMGLKYESAADTEAEAELLGNRTELVSEFRRANKAPSQKVQFIRRQRASVIRAKGEVKNVKGTPIITKAKAKPKKTEALTYETVSGEETVEKKAARLKAVKEANTRLRFALNRAKKFLARFGTTGEYGTFASDAPEFAAQFRRATDAFRQLVQMAESTLASGNKSSAHITMAREVAASLARIKLKGMSPNQFTAEFSAIAKETEGRMLKAAKVKESVETRDEKIEDYNKNTKDAADRIEMLESNWKGDSIYNEIVGPIFRKFSEMSLLNSGDPSQNAYYHPTLEEVEALRYAVRTFRNMQERYDNNTFYKPLVKQLKYYGFEFDATGDVIVKEFSPSDYILGPGFLAKTGQSSQSAEPGKVAEAPEYTRKPRRKKGEKVKDYNARVREWTRKKQRKVSDPDVHSDAIEAPRVVLEPPVMDEDAALMPNQEDKLVLGARVTSVGAGVAEAVSPTDVRAKQEINENRTAVQNVRTANSLLQRFKDMIASSKTTINGLKRQEQRFIRGLRKIGAWRDVSPGMGQIVIGGWKTKTYRLVGPRLDARTMSKAEARAAIEHTAKLAMPRALGPVARAMDAAPPRPGEQSATERMDALVDENTTEFFLETLALEENSPALDEAAAVVGDIIRDNYSRAKIGDVLDAITDSLPSDHFYHRLAVKLKAMGMSDVTLQYDWTGSKFFGKKRGHLGMFDPNTNRAYLNRNQMQDGMGTLAGTRAIHTILHETLHAATHQSLSQSPALSNRMFQIRAAAYHAWVKANGNKNVPLGLRLTSADGTVMPLDEFVVEVFADESLQDFLHTVPVEMEGSVTRLAAAWSRIKDILLEIMGWTNVPPTRNLLDAFMSTEDKVFEGAGLAREGSEVLHMENYGTALREIAMPFFDRFESTSKILQTVREKGANAVLAITSMEQFVERFTGKLIKEGRDLIQEYDAAFSQRNAKAAYHLEIPQQISAAWSQLEASNAEEAVAVSQIGTEASLLTIDPRVAVTDEANAHLGEDLHAEHARLHAQYNGLSTAAKAVFNDSLAYYADSLETETMFLMQSALRGMLATGENAALTMEAFEGKFSIAALKELKTREDLSNALAEHFEESGRRDVLDTLYKMSMVPRKRQGIYMPMMRYGDDVAFAEKAQEDVIYEDRRTAMGKRAELLSDDPTLDVGVFPTDEGTFALRTVERVFIMGESVSEVESLRDEMVADPSNSLTADDFYDTQKRLSKELDTAIESNAALGSILKTLSGNTAAQAAIKNFYLRNLSEKSFRKHEIKRKNRKGVRYDLQHRNLATYAKQASYYTAQLEFGWKMSKALSEMYDVATRTKSESGTEGGKLTNVVKHLQSRDALSADIPTRGKFTSKSIEATHFFMLASPSYWAINASQPWMVTLPTLGARHGWITSASAMKQFQSVIFKDLATEAVEMKGGLTAFGKNKAARVEETFNIIRQIEERLKIEYGADAKGYIDMLEFLRANHIIDINVFTEMRDVAVGKRKNKWDQTIDAARIMAHLTEVNNRAVTALAAYQLELNKTGDVQAATEYAGKMVSQTQFNYSAENKPPVFQKAPLLFQFMQWPQHMYAHLIRNYQGMVQAGVMEKSEARSALLGLIGTHAAVGGMTGMMLQPIKWAFGLALMAFGDEDEPYTFTNAVSGRSYDRMVTSVADNLFGTTAATFIGKGIPAGLGVDLSIRMSMGTVYFVDLRGDNAQSVLGSMVASFGGATLNQGLKFAMGAGKMMDGDIYRGLETMSPKIARDAMRAGRYYNEGLVNNAGDTVIPASEMNLGEVMAQFFGFAPTDVSQAYEAQNAIKDAEGYNIDRKDSLMRRYRDAAPSQRSEVKKDIKAFNKANKGGEIITTSSLLSNRRSQKIREFRFSRYGANIDERKAKFYEKYANPYRDDE